MQPDGVGGTAAAPTGAGKQRLPALQIASESSPRSRLMRTQLSSVSGGGDTARIQSSPDNSPPLEDIVIVKAAPLKGDAQPLGKAVPELALGPPVKPGFTALPSDAKISFSASTKSTAAASGGSSGAAYRQSRKVLPAESGSGGSDEEAGPRVLYARRPLQPSRQGSHAVLARSGTSLGGLSDSGRTPAGSSCRSGPSNRFQRATSLASLGESDGGSSSQSAVKRGRKRAALARLAAVFLASKRFAAALAVATAFALFAGDLRLWLAPPAADSAFAAGFLVVLVFFVCEMGCSAAARPDDYLWFRPSFAFMQLLREIPCGSFDLWVDLGVLVSIGFQMVAALAPSSLDVVSFGSSAWAVAVPRAAHATSSALQVGRAVRLFRLPGGMQLWRWVRLRFTNMKETDFSSSRQRDAGLSPRRPLLALSPKTPGGGRGSGGGGAQGARDGSDAARNPSNAAYGHAGSPSRVEWEGDSRRDSSDAGGLSAPSTAAMPTRVGTAMTNLTTHRVVMGLLLVLAVSPLLTVPSVDGSALYGATIVHDFGARAVVDARLEYGAGAAIREFVATTSNLLDLSVDGETMFQVAEKRLRASDRAIIRLRDVVLGDVFETQATLSIKESVQATSRLNIAMTCCIVVLVAAGTWASSKDLRRLVLRPIEVIVRLVRDISTNPLTFAVPAEHKDVFQEDMETTLLMQSVGKIAGLMRVGFGQAGAVIIARNLLESDKSHLNLLTPGRPIEAIFGFCDVRQFTNTTECLQEEVMLFVNRIAHIVHGVVVQCGGAANKNVGDAFLLMWPLEGVSDKGIPDVADRALLSFLKIMAEMERHQEYVCSFSVRSMARLYSVMPDYKVKMGFGLHMGWALEGAIGSEKKIDASYLSPHVNMAEYLESSTKEYGVPLLMSEAFYNFLSPAAQRWCRQVDRVQQRANAQPMGLYTCDANQDQISAAAAAASQSHLAHDAAASSFPDGQLMPAAGASARTFTARRRTSRDPDANPASRLGRPAQRDRTGSIFDVAFRQTNVQSAGGGNSGSGGGGGGGGGSVGTSAHRGGASRRPSEDVQVRHLIERRKASLMAKGAGYAGGGGGGGGSGGGGGVYNTGGLTDAFQMHLQTTGAAAANGERSSLNGFRGGAAPPQLGYNGWLDRTRLETVAGSRIDANSSRRTFQSSGSISARSRDSSRSRNRSPGSHGSPRSPRSPRDSARAKTLHSPVGLADTNAGRSGGGGGGGSGGFLAGLSHAFGFKTAVNSAPADGGAHVGAANAATAPASPAAGAAAGAAAAAGTAAAAAATASATGVGHQASGDAERGAAGGRAQAGRIGSVANRWRGGSVDLAGKSPAQRRHSSIASELDVLAAANANAGGAASANAPDIVVGPYSPAVWEADEDLRCMRAGVTQEQLAAWAEAFSCYLKGDWTRARQLLERHVQDVAMSGGLSNGPAQALLGYMAANAEEGGVAPASWAGYRGF